MIAIGVHVHAEPERLRATLAALNAHTPRGFDLLLLPDGPDPETCAALRELAAIPQSASEAALGAAACFNRLVGATTADTLVFLESGTIVSPGWLEPLREALAADPRHGLASPSTNRAWNQLAAFPHGCGDDDDIAGTAAEAARRFGRTWRSLAPLWDVGDFCLAVRRAACEKTGPADEAYGQGPCWEMDYAIRAVRAGFLAVWAPGSYVFRHPFTARRQREEARLFEASRRRYQDKFCGLRLTGARTGYVRHCQGESCQHFAPKIVDLAAPRAAARPPIIDRIPLVSCVMPTKGRPEWMVQAIGYFERQDYPNRELVIVDASPASLAHLIPDDPRIRYRHAPSHRTIGDMRNLACELAAGEIVIHWDDDDWYAAKRISAQVQPILAGLADVTALNGTTFFELDSWTFWHCTTDLHRRLFVHDVHGGTLAFRRSLFTDTCRYPNISLAEDAYFLHLAVQQGARLAPITGDGLFMYLRHAGNAWNFPCGRYLDATGWQRGTEPDCIAADRSFYAARSQAMARCAAPAAAGSQMPAVIARKPLVSCIMPTNNRRLFVADTIALFLRQDHCHKELIIIDDGTDAVADLVPADARLRYFRETPQQTVGAKRNRACSEARGDVIAHWDDDDWYAPWRLSYQLAELQNGEVEICGLDRVLFLDEPRRRGWEYVYPAGGTPWVHGATLCYRREAWCRNPFHDISIGEDNRFLAAANGRGVHLLDRREFYVGHIHATNVSPKQTNDPRWQRLPYETVKALIY
jgi:O-antigen biosynthesis protein